MGQIVKEFCERISCMGPVCKHFDHCHFHMYEHEVEQSAPEEYVCPVCGHKNAANATMCAACSWPRVA